MADRDEEKKPFTLFTRLSDWVLCGITVASVVAVLLWNGRVIEFVDTQKVFNQQQTTINESFHKSMTDMAVAQAIGNVELKNMTKLIGDLSITLKGIKDLKEYNQSIDDHNLQLKQMMNQLNNMHKQMSQDSKIRALKMAYR